VGLSLLLLGYGAAGLLGNFVVGRLIDRRPGPVLTVLLAVLVVSVAALAPVLGTVPTVIAALVWGGAFTAIPVCLAAGILRVAPTARDAGSAVYVVAFQIGIGGGAFVGERFVGAGQLGWLPVLTAAFALVACLLVVGSRQAFPRRLEDADYHRTEAEVVGTPA
jgi:predicted MFS family arabinose efflux permease